MNSLERILRYTIAREQNIRILICKDIFRHNFVVYEDNDCSVGIYYATLTYILISICYQSSLNRLSF